VLPAHLARAIVPAVLCGSMVILYTYLVRSTAIPGSRGSSGSFVAAGELWSRTVYFGDVLWRRFVMKNFGRGALKLGLAELRAAPLWLGVCVAVLAAALVPFARWWMGRGRTAAAGCDRACFAASAPVRTALLVLAGLAIFITGFFPILIFAGYEPDSRTRYWPTIGLAIALAALVPARRDGGVRSRPVAVIALVLLLATLAASSVTFIGIQSAFRARSERDRAEAAALRAQIPDPEPLTFFVPLRIEGRAVRTGSPVLDGHFRGVWEFPWTAPRYILHVYRRDDVRCGFYRHWQRGFPVLGAAEDGIHYGDRLGPRFPQLAENAWLIAWERAIPFVVTPEGELRVVTRVILESAGATEREIKIPQAQHLPEFAASLPAR
jgi:hypothetical protein